MTIRISRAEQARRVKVAKARVALTKIWSDFDLTTLEFIELLAEQAYHVTAALRAGDADEREDDDGG